MGELKEQLVRIFPDRHPHPWVPKEGAASLSYCQLDILNAFRKYCECCANRDVEDPRKICVTLFEENFPKLLKLWLKPSGKLPTRKARAKVVIPLLHAGTFNQDLYTWQDVRLRTLFWLEDVIREPDGIYPNCAQVVEGEEVYIKRYNKELSDVKLVFTTIRPGGTRAIITSFLDTASNIGEYCAENPLYCRSCPSKNNSRL
ncbi:MAG: hypothetical protein JWQ87_3727 [Candidatus Sulfotelmatobacter sp.]|nr:hypothetical protein [Candidatus Sulfotelmatobacter sp.]